MRKYATNRSENVCSRWSASIMAFLSIRRSSQSVNTVAEPMRKGLSSQPAFPEKLSAT